MKTSIIIPFVDEYDFLREALASALTQEVDKEVIVVCNANSLAREYDVLFNQFQDVKFLHEPTPGSAFARNAGLAAATGDWVQFLDVDDILLTGKIKRQLAFDIADVIVSPHTYQLLSGKKAASAWEPDDIWSALLAGHLGSTSSMLWRRSALLEARGWNESFYRSQEYELIFRLLKAGNRIACCDDNLTLVRQRRGSITNTTRYKPWAGITLRESIWTYLNEHAMTTPRRFDAFRKYIFKNVRVLYGLEVEKARSLHHKYFSDPPFTPHIPHIPFYKMMYNSFGFESTEKIIGQYKYLRDSIIKKLFPSSWR